ncbi:reverse transcriptase N-terminal domain-containing protein [Nocardia brasiliensis]|uniref:reverse transcriptase N-terminal domain-containing protein n=1 Tax=Nocardia brasiliensis TaxID=37326 RepID=UPI000B25A784|nr:reverse transcriptase N-terminal domain-containing protein [Nocardia brasiliensis]
MNGPEGDADLWHSIDWRQEEAHVKRLRQRIFRAARNGDHKQVRNLQKLMLRSRANVVTSVRRVTQLSTGKKTAGIDGTVALQNRRTWTAGPAYLSRTDRRCDARQTRVHPEGQRETAPARNPGHP